MPQRLQFPLLFPPWRPTSSWAVPRVTKSRRTPYDALMPQLHDCMKGDDSFQKESPQSTVDLPAGSTWLAFTDQVSHAATAGQYQLEQTFLLPVDAMGEPERSPLRVVRYFSIVAFASPDWDQRRAEG